MANPTKDNWRDDKNNIVFSDMKDLMQIAGFRQFGESEQEDLTSFLLCTAFEYRFDPMHAAAFRLAAMIISRVPEMQNGGK